MQTNISISGNRMEIPERLHTKDLPANQVFGSEEYIFRRFNSMDPKVKNQVSTSALPFDVGGDSYNRGFYCSCPEDVLYEIHNQTDIYKDYGILFFIIEELYSQNGNVTTGSGREQKIYKVDAKAIHDPTPLMYPHTIMEISVDDVVMREQLSPNLLRRVYREKLRRICKIYREPQK